MFERTFPTIESFAKAIEDLGTINIGGDQVYAFRGSDSDKVDATGKALLPDGIYWEPTDYEGDVVFAGPFEDLHGVSDSVEAWVLSDLLSKAESMP